MTSAGTSARTVGAYEAPSRLPPASSVAPAATASSTQDSTRLAASSLTSGPTSVASSDGSPVTCASTAATICGSSRSYTEASAITRCTEMQDWPPW